MNNILHRKYVIGHFVIIHHLSKTKLNIHIYTSKQNYVNINARFNLFVHIFKHLGGREMG